MSKLYQFSLLALVVILMGACSTSIEEAIIQPGQVGKEHENTMTQTEIDSGYEEKRGST